MRYLALLLLAVVGCGRDPKPPPPAADRAVTKAPTAAEASAAYDAKQYARCAELFVAVGGNSEARQADHFYNAACCYALDGKPDQAFAMLERSTAAGLRDDRHMAADTDLVSLHADPRWAPALKAVSAAREAAETLLREPALRLELLALVEEDQAARNAWIESDFKDAAAEQRVRASDRTTTARLKEVIAKHGWPGKTLVGEEGAHAAWLLIQHADADRDFQRQCLTLIEKAAAAGEASRTDYAYLYDRLAVADKRPQRYGTQYNGDKPAPIEDEAHVDARRKSVGLGTMAEYDQQMRATYGKNLGNTK